MPVIDKRAADRVRHTVEEAARSREGKLAAGAATATAAAAVAARALLHRGDDEDGGGISRAYRLKRGEPVAFGLRRVARGRVDHAVELLHDPDADEVEAVHGARKDLKKLRSVLRLVRPLIGERIYERENARHREAARLLSGVRDRQALEETIDGLEERYPDEAPRGGWRALRGALRVEAREVDVAALRQEAAKRVEAGRRATETLPLPGKGGEVLAPGLKRSYSRGRRRLEEAAADPSDERLHEWRKRSKDLWYHLRLVRTAWPETLEPLVDEAHELSDLLGDDHDLVVLTARVQECRERLGSERHAELERLIRERRMELQGEAFALGERLYGEKPKAFAARIARYWDAPAPA